MPAESCNSASMSAMSDNIPLKKSKGSRYPQWFSTELITLFKKKQGGHRKYKRSMCVGDYAVFSGLRREVKIEMNNCKKAHAQSVEGELRSKPANFWKYINGNRRDPAVLPAVTVDNRVITDPKELCSLFGEYFASVYQSFDSRLIDESTTDQNFKKDILPSVDVPRITVDDVLSAIQGLKNRSASGIDGIPSFIVKGVAEIISPALVSLFNWSLLGGEFPSIWKTAVVTPIPKKGPSCLSNFRPISVVGVIPKIFEKVVCNFLCRRTQHLISPHQHGFMAGRSTVTNLSSFLSVAGPAVEHQGQVDTIYLDFQKAFDKLPHHLFLRKLPAFGLSPVLIRWIKSYLCGRTFRVKFGGEVSDCFIASSGVPQGSNLGPLFFTIFVNDITSVLNCSVQLFADDVKISMPISGIKDHLALQSAVDSAVKWATANHMPLNLGKTVVVSFTRKTNPSYFSYFINGSRIQRRDAVSDLGVHMDSKLIFSQHISNVVSKARRNLGLIMWISRFFSNKESCVTLYRSLVRSHLEYATVVWNRDRGYSDHSIEAVQKKFFTWMVYKFPDLVGLDIRQILHLPNLSARRTLADLLFFHRVLHGHSISVEKIGLRVPEYTFRRSRLFTTSPEGVCDPVTRCVGIANNFIENLDFFYVASNYIRQVKIILEI